MKTELWKRGGQDRRYFVGGSDARIIMGKDEAALLRLWQEKRGEAEPENLSSNLIVQLGLVTEELNRRWYEANTGQVITDIQKRIRHPGLRWMAATLDGRGRVERRGVRGQIHAAVVVLGRGSRRKVHATAAAQHVGTPIGISRGTPRGTVGYRRLRALEPGDWFRSVTPARYLELYSEILDRLEPAEIYDRLIAFSDNPVLLCWETASDCHLGRTFCHRHLVAQWLEDRLDIDVPEVGHITLDRFAFLRAHGIEAPDYRTSRTHPT